MIIPSGIFFFKKCKLPWIKLWTSWANVRLTPLNDFSSNFRMLFYNFMKVRLIRWISIETFWNKIIPTICFFTCKVTHLESDLWFTDQNVSIKWRNFTSATSFSRKSIFSLMQLRGCEHSFIFVVNYPATEIYSCVHDYRIFLNRSRGLYSKAVYIQGRLLLYILFY